MSDELEGLRAELQRRMTCRPATSWSPRLLSALIAVFDLEFGPLPNSSERPKLRIVGEV